MKWYSYLMLVTVLILLFSVMGCASTKTRFITMNNSYHYDKDKTYNENHNGIGFEYEFDENWQITYMNFKNSQYNRAPDRDRSHSIWIGHEWNPIDKVYIGFKFGAADGYGREQEDIFMLGGATFRYAFSPAVSVYTFITPVVAVDGIILQVQDK